MNAKVSVIIPAYNYGEFIADAIHSVLDQTYPIAEVIVVDDGSEDDIESVVRRFGDKVRYIRQHNLGVCAARNRGITESTGEFIAFLDADDLWLPEKIREQVSKFCEHPEIGLVHCGMREFDSETGETIRLHLEGGEGWVAREIALWERSVVIGPGGTIMVKREVIDRVGVFDPQLTNGEDWEFCFRVASRFKVGFVREVLVEYRNHGVNVTKNVNEMERSTLLAWEKVFNTDDREIRELRRRSYGNLHKVLAGSYLHIGEYSGFVRNLLKSLWYRPTYLGYYLTLAVHRKKN